MASSILSSPLRVICLESSLVPGPPQNFGTVVPRTRFTTICELVDLATRLRAYPSSTNQLYGYIFQHHFITIIPKSHTAFCHVLTVSLVRPLGFTT